MLLTTMCNGSQKISLPTSPCTAVLREIFSDLFEECPNLTLIHSQIGGAFFAIVELVLPQPSRTWEEVERFDLAAHEKIRRYLTKNLSFDLTHPFPLRLRGRAEGAVFCSSILAYTRAVLLRRRNRNNPIGFLSPLP